jgi:hypothetical protein
LAVAPVVPTTASVPPVPCPAKLVPGTPLPVREVAASCEKPRLPLPAK